MALSVTVTGWSEAAPDALQELELLARFWHHSNLHALFHSARIIIFLSSIQNAVFSKDYQGLVARTGKSPRAAPCCGSHMCRALSESVDTVWVPPAHPLPLCHSRRRSHNSCGGRGVVTFVSQQ